MRGKPDERGAQAKVLGKGGWCTELPGPLWVQHPFNLLVSWCVPQLGSFSNLIQEFCWATITIGYWWLKSISRLSPLFRDQQGSGAESGVFFWQPASILKLSRDLAKSCLIRVTKSLRKIQTFLKFCARNQGKDQIHSAFFFLLYNSHC